MEFFDVICRRSSVRSYKNQEIDKELLLRLVDAGDKKDYAKDLGVLLNAPADLKLVSIVSLGLPLNEEGQVKKRSTEQVLHWENF